MLIWLLILRLLIFLCALFNASYLVKLFSFSDEIYYPDKYLPHTRVGVKRKFLQRFCCVDRNKIRVPVFPYELKERVIREGKSKMIFSAIIHERLLIIQSISVQLRPVNSESYAVFTGTWFYIFFLKIKKDIPLPYYRHIFRYEKNKNGRSKWPFTLKDINRIMVLNVITAHCFKTMLHTPAKKS